MTAKKPNAERGVAIVEAAVTLPILFIFLFGLMEVGRLISVQQALTNAAREGARARVTPYSQTSYLADAFVVKDTVCTFLSAASITCDPSTVACDGAADETRICVNEDPHVPDSTVCPTNGNPVAGCTIVHVEVPYRPFLASLFGISSVTLQAEALMRNETSP
jgi:Flp pilus assembly protein TadG